MGDTESSTTETSHDFMEGTESSTTETAVPQTTYYENSRGKYAITKYRSCEFILIDDIPAAYPRNEHTRKNDMMRNFFHKYTDCDISGLQLSDDRTVENWNKFWNEKLQGKRDGDVIILYYHGLAMGNGGGYRWHFQDSILHPVNAYDFIEKINRTSIDCLLILDCWLPTRFHDFWKRDTELHGNTEIFSRGQEMPRIRGHPADLSGDFTISLISYMTRYLKRTLSGRGYAPRSIPEIMKDDKELHCNPTRVWINRPKKPHEELIRRIKVLPWEIRRSGIFEFYALQVQPLVERYQGYGPGNFNNDPSEPQPNDEGFVEDFDMVEKSVAGDSESSGECNGLFVPGGLPWDSDWEDNA